MNSHYRSLAFIFMVLLSNAAHAFDTSSFLAPGAEGQFIMERYSREIESDQQQSELRIFRVGVNLFESPYSWVQGGFLLGYLETSHDNNILTAGHSPVGKYFGIKLRSPKAQQQPLALHWSLSYLYNTVEQSGTSSGSDILWHDYQAELGIQFNAGNTRFSIGGYVAGMEGEEDRWEVISPSPTQYSSRQFKGDASSGAFLTAGYRIQRHHYIELKAKTGALQGASLSFATQY